MIRFFEVLTKMTSFSPCQIYVGYVGCVLCKDEWLIICVRGGVLLEKKHGLEMGIQTLSNIKDLCGRVVVGNWCAICRRHIAISGIQDVKRVSHCLT